MKAWYNMKERSAGAFRLYLLWAIYKIFGKKFLDFVVFFVALVSFCFAKEVRKYSAKYFKIISNFANLGIKPTIFNLFRHYFSYAISLSDKIQIFSGDFDYKKIFFESEVAKEELFADFKNKKGVFFICNHLGNVDVMRAFLASDFEYSDINVNVFLQKNQTKIFNEFIEKISAKRNLSTYPVEEISIENAIELKEKLDMGEIIFMAGDRISAQNANATAGARLFGEDILLPIGTFKFALILEVPIYFVSCVRLKNGFYKVILKNAEILDGAKKAREKKLQSDFVEFLQTNTIKSPFQFFHFYDIFSSNNDENLFT